MINPLKNIGVNFYPVNKSKLPIFIKGSNYLRPIKYFENRGSAQCKTSVMFASLNVPGKIKIKAKAQEIIQKICLKPLIFQLKRKKHLIMILSHYQNQNLLKN